MVTPEQLQAIKERFEDAVSMSRGRYSGKTIYHEGLLVLAEVERLRKENADLSQMVLHDTHDEFVAQQEIKRLREELTAISYCDNVPACKNDICNQTICDIAKIARKALVGEQNAV